MNYWKAIYYQHYRKSHPIYLILIHIFLLFISVGVFLFFADILPVSPFWKYLLCCYAVLSIHTYLPVVLKVLGEKYWLFLFLFPAYTFSFLCPIVLLFYVKKGKLHFE